MFYSTTDRPQPHRYIYIVPNDNLAHRTDVSSEREYSASVGFSGRGSIGVLRRKGELKSEFTPNCQRLVEPSFVEYKSTTLCGTDNVVRISLAEKPSPSYLVKCFNPSQTLEWMKDFRILQQYRRKFEAEERAETNRRYAKSLTSGGKTRVADACALLEYKYGTKRLGFYTLTCPYTDPVDIQNFNDSYPEIIRRYFQELRREYERRDVCFSYIGVYEIQPGRCLRTGHECLHFHYVCRAYDGRGRFVFHHSEMRSLYERIIVQVCGKAAHHLPRVDCQIVKRSPSGYLSKYFSKSGGTTTEGGAGLAVARLSSWYSISRNLLTAIKRSRVVLPGHIADDLFRASREGKRLSYVRYLRPVYVQSDGVTYHVGTIFELTGEFFLTLREIVFPQVSHLF